jgi:hypothetical protein
MAKRDANGTMKYWYEATSCSLIKGRAGISVGSQDYWYNGQPLGFLLTSSFIAKPRFFAVLVGF